MNDGTYLFRQVSPSWVQLGRVTSQAFKPTPKDEFKLSVYDGDLISAEKSWMHFTNQLRLQSIGVLAVTVQECTSLELTASADPEAFAEHAIIDFRGLGTSQIEKKSKRLREVAVARGWRYQGIDID